MIQYFKQNKQVITIAFSVFIISIASMVFVFGSNSDLHNKDLKANVIHETSHFSSEAEALAELNGQGHGEHGEQSDPKFLIIKTDGAISLVSDQLAEEFGQSKEELQHQNLFGLVNSEDLPTFLGSFGKILQTHEGVEMMGPFRLVVEEGNEIKVMANGKPIMNHGAIDKIVIKITEIKAKIDKAAIEKEKEEAQPKESKKIKNVKNKNSARLMAEKDEIVYGF